MASTRKPLPRSFWFESVLAGVCAALFVLTLFWHDWLEALGVDPDRGNGSAEWLMVAALACLALLNATLARSTWRKAGAPAAA